MKIIHLIKGGEWGGVARYVLDFCAAMDSSGHEVTLLSGATDSIDDNFRFCGLRVVKAPLKKFGDWRSLSVLSKIIGSGEPSIIHVHGFLDAFPAVMARLQFGRRRAAIVVTRDIVKQGSHSLFNRWICGAVDKVVLERVNWLGFHENVHPFIESVDVIVCPSTVRGSFQLSALESMAHGRPVITTDNGGQVEYIKSGHNGVLVSPGDSAGLAEAIRGLIASPELRLRLGRNALSDFRETLSYPVFTAKMQKIYEDVLMERCLP